MKIIFHISLLFSPLTWAQAPKAKANRNSTFNSIGAPDTFFQGLATDYSVDPEPDAQKGAALLVWQKDRRSSAAEVEIRPTESPNRIETFVVSKNFFHIMVFFDREYSWKVRYLDENHQPISNFSAPSSFQIQRKQKTENLAVQNLGKPKETRPFGKDKNDPHKIVFDLPHKQSLINTKRGPASHPITNFMKAGTNKSLEDTSDYSY